MYDTVFDKTLKGRREIAHREFGLSARLRTLLLLVDGRRTGRDILRLVDGFGLSERHLDHLCLFGYIREAARLGRARSSLERAADPRLRALYLFYTDTIRRHIGLRGYTLQLQVEMADSWQALAMLRGSFLQAVLQAKGNDVARTLQYRLDALLDGEELSAAAY